MPPNWCVVFCILAAFAVASCSAGPPRCAGPERDATGGCVFVEPPSPGALGGVCTPSAASACSGAECVGAGFVDLDTGVCVSECDATDGVGCPPGFDCNEVFDPVSGMTFGSCSMRCDDVHPCAAGLVCGRFGCQAPECDATHPCLGMASCFNSLCVFL